MRGLGDQEGCARRGRLAVRSRRGHRARGVPPGPAAPIPGTEISVRAVAPRPEVARLLVGQPRAAPEARVELRGGVFVGTSIPIHLVAGARGVELRLGAPTEAARLALASVIDRVGLHLRSRGIVMRPGASSDTGPRRQRDDRERKG
ncbi:MAG TPA: hypothetical protein VG319_09195 [Polyangia bacterium]|nr:hypothetical protein [Polyangia bacterium]